MNKPRRNALNKLYEKIDELKTLLEDVLAEEQEAFDNIPESLEGSERYCISEAAIENMESAVSSLEEALEYVESAAE